jgi:hypothetical protein
VFGPRPDNDKWIKFKEDVWCHRIRLQSVPKKVNVELTCDELKKFKPDPTARTWIKLSGTSEEIQTVLKLAKVRDMKNVNITVNRISSGDLFIPSKERKSFVAIVEEAVTKSYPHLLEHHKSMVG